MTEETVDVLVVGAGLGGLSASMFLAQQGIRVLTVERHPSTAIHPRASGQSLRTMELYRFAGIDEKVLGVSKRASQGLRITIAESLNGHVIHRILEDVSEIDLNAAVGVPWGMAGQDVVEPILLARAEELGARVRFSTELVSFEQDDDGVTAVLSSGTVRAKYLVAADGGRSRIRERLGIDTEGMGVLGNAIGVVFDADLGDRLEPDVTDLYHLRHSSFTGVLVNTDVPNRFVFGTDFHPEKGEKADDFTPERVTELIRLATDLPGLRPDIRWIGAWEMAAKIASRFRSGRVLLVGDAAKVTPPTGGMGGNTAVGDGHDVAWKLAAVLRGEAGPALLDSYEAERKPFAELVVNASLHNLKHRMMPHLDISGLPEPVNQVELALGYRCFSAAVLIEDDDPRPTEDPNRPSGRAGFRAPHVPITVDGISMSTVDLLGHVWVLVTADPSWRPVVATAGEAVGLRLDCRVLGSDFDASEELFLARYGIQSTGATLVRPDGVVAWRAVTGVDDPDSTLREVLTHLLSR
ncbi:aklavinone 12-hydroxylase RdmE [Amycolatopsis taiwanensis]|uniref:FAD-dependent oxidoreductase n=1 Tax=Amycolatopsis taiwanensis TaxID=342230 RepID=A0A9W6QVW7_9PSEU|nr:FAD-dependent oxidoreductase [Amycolatopsis taiwanensis]GLY64544.1 FAD-dependent oxidoreductase [Amycolatopsis taiwanensis]